MKKTITLFLVAVLTLSCIWWVSQGNNSGEIPSTPGQSNQIIRLPLNENSGNTVKDLPIPHPTGSVTGLVISQKFDPERNEPRGTATLGTIKIDLGEAPPYYRYQLQAVGYPLMLGDKHERRMFWIEVNSLVIGPNGANIKSCLLVRYPRWEGLLSSSGGLVFDRDDIPITKIGVIVPKVIIPQGHDPEAIEYQVDIRMSDPLNEVDPRTKAKEQFLGTNMRVLMATHPDKIPASAPVVWFKFEKDGTVSLQE